MTMSSMASSRSSMAVNLVWVGFAIALNVAVVLDA